MLWKDKLVTNNMITYRKGNIGREAREVNESKILSLPYMQVNLFIKKTILHLLNNLEVNPNITLIVTGIFRFAPKKAAQSLIGTPPLAKQNNFEQQNI